jgi:SAM-dependent methyltransferase
MKAYLSRGLLAVHRRVIPLKAGLLRAFSRAVDGLHGPLRKRTPDPFFQVFPEFVRRVGAMPAPTVLELGARNVTGQTQRQHFQGAGRYIGCDIHPGEGVDLVADIHDLSKAVAPGSVDAVFSVSVFEHLVYPWRAVLEINKVLKPGGYVFIATHPSWPAHELPWDFWRFPVAGLAHLLIPETGFEVVMATEGVPAKIYSISPDPLTRGVRYGVVNLGVAIIARKIADYDADKLRWDIDMTDVVRSEYPRPS